MKLYSYPFKLCQISMLSFFLKNQFFFHCVIFYRNYVCIYLILYLSILWLLNINLSRLPDRQMAETKATNETSSTESACKTRKPNSVHICSFTGGFLKPSSVLLYTLSDRNTDESTDSQISLDHLSLQFLLFFCFT